MDSPSAIGPSSGYGARAIGMSTLGRQFDEMERGEMSDSTNPPHMATRETTEPTSPITYVCGERNDKCICIEDHHETYHLGHKTWHVCYQCGDEWYT